MSFPTINTNSNIVQPTWIVGQKFEDIIVALRISMDTTFSPSSAPKNQFTQGYLIFFF